MKKIKCFLISLTLLLSICASAETPDTNQANKWVALQIALTFNRINSAEDLAMLFSDRPKVMAQIQDDLKKNKNATFERPQIFMPADTLVEFHFSKRTIALDYSKIDQNILLMNKFPIKLESKKSFLNYQIEVEQILSRKTSLRVYDLLVPTAEAADLLEPIFAYMSAVLVHTGIVFPDRLGVTIGNPGPSIVKAYENQMKFHIGTDIKNKAKVGTYFPETFKCEKGRLSSMEQSSFSTDGKVSKLTSESDNVLVKTSKGYKYTSISGVVETDTNWKVTASSYQSVGVGSDFSEQAPFFKFPQVADKCCATNGCWEMVQQAFNQTMKKAEQTFKSGGTK